VIELKATGATIAQHRAGYKTGKCVKRPCMSSGHANTSYMRHQLQVGFGALCIGGNVGVVVVSCADGAVSYPLDVAMAAEHLFKFDAGASAPGRPTLSSRVEAMAPWPAHSASLFAALEKSHPGISSWNVEECAPASARLVGPSGTIIVCVVSGTTSKSKLRGALAAATAVDPKLPRFAVAQRARGWKVLCLV
jgi:hypothetical protein